jgi:alpha-tubulin suppressor-like RCC1 family protein
MEYVIKTSIQTFCRRFMTPFTARIWLIALVLTIRCLSGGAPVPLTVVAWGDNGYGEVDVPSSLTNAYQAVAGSGHSLALNCDGTVAAWGGNGYSPPAGLSGVRELSERDSVGCALLSNGTVVAWGANYYGGLNVPPGLSEVVSVAAGDFHVLALKSDGTVVGWGGQESAGVVPPGLDSITAVAGGGNHSLALKSDGTVVAWGWNVSGQASVPPGLTNVVAISAGGYHSMALKADGTVVVWGGQDASVQPPVGLSGVRAISAGEWHNLALLSNGTVVAWGGNSFGQCNLPSGLKDVVAVSAGRTHSLALSTSSTPLIRANPQSATASAGGNASFSVNATGPGTLTYQWLKAGSLGPGGTASILQLSNVGPADAGNYSCAVSSFGGSVTSAPALLTVVGLTTGSSLVSLDGPDVPEGFTDLKGVAASRDCVIGVKADGAVGVYLTSLAFGTSMLNIPSGLTNVVAVAAGESFGLALQSGTVTAWGNIAAPPPDLTGVTSIAAGNNRAYAVKADGSVVSWGSGVISPPPLSNVVAVSGSWDCGLALLALGTATPWGALSSATFATESNLVAISLGGPNTGAVNPLGLRADGTVAGGGVPAGLAGVAAISSGGGYGLALKSDGTVVGLANAQIKASLSHVTSVAAGGGYGLVFTRWPVIKTQPQSVTNQPGTTATFTAGVRGAGPFTFQWQKEGSNIPGANGVTLALNNVSASDIASYTLIAGNAFGSVTSQPAMLQVFGAPQVLAQPKSQRVFEGARVGFSLTVTGAAPLTIQWYHGSSAIIGANNLQLMLAGVSVGDAGSYEATVSNHVGQIASPSASLVVDPAPHWTNSPPGTVVGLWGPAVPPGLTNAVALAAGTRHALALRADGTVVGWGNDFLGGATPPAGLSNVVAISAGDDLSLALNADGTVVGWGSLGSAVPADLYGVIAIAAGYQRSIALKTDGAIVQWGPGNTGPDLPPGYATNIIAVDAGFEGNVALRDDGTLITWGGLLNPGGYNPPTVSNLVAVSIGRLYVLGLHNDGTVYGSPVALSNVVAVAAGGDSMGLALNNDGTVIGWGGATAPAGLTGVSALAAGGFGLVITTNAPPSPVLALSQAGGQVVIEHPVSVPGYLLEASDALSFKFVEVPGYTNAFIFTNSQNQGFSLTPSGDLKILRLRRP